MQTGLRLTLVCVLGVCAAQGASSDDTAPGLVAIVGGEVRTGLGPAMRDATVLLRDGRIEAVGEGVVIPPGARILDVKGAIVTPGFVDADGALPLPESERFGARWGLDLRAADAIVRDDPRLATARRQGVTAFLVTGDARGNFGGTAALVVTASPAEVLPGEAPPRRWTGRAAFIVGLWVVIAAAMAPFGPIGVAIALPVCAVGLYVHLLHQFGQGS